MNRYQNGKIYKIVDIGYNKCYYGSTCEQLSRRLARHRIDYRRYQKGNGNFTSSFYLFDEYGLDNIKIELVENYPTSSKEELVQHEGTYIQNNNCVNKRIAGRTDKGWYQANKAHVQQKHKEYYESNKEHLNRISVERERVKRQDPKYKDYINERMRKYNATRPEALSEKNKRSYEKNKDKILARQNAKYTCSCGSVIRHAEKSTHERTKKHQHFLEQQA